MTADDSLTPTDLKTIAGSIRLRARALAMCADAIESPEVGHQLFTQPICLQALNRLVGALLAEAPAIDEVNAALQGACAIGVVQARSKRGAAP